AKKLRATSEISEVFGSAPAKKTIHVIVQRPLEVTNRVSEAEFVQHVLSNITGTDQTLRSKTKTSTRRVYSADGDAEWQPDIPDKASVEDMLSKEQPEDKATKRDSDFVPGCGGGKWKQGFRAYLTRS
ncbi:hypothetical protein BX616_009138, partial [Lobosporangium transversale]